jgi:hypothetical protein
MRRINNLDLAVHGALYIAFALGAWNNSKNPHPKPADNQQSITQTVPSAIAPVPQTPPAP